jgi:uncharacterized protein YggT (Ycf19 family)
MASASTVVSPLISLTYSAVSSDRQTCVSQGKLSGFRSAVCREENVASYVFPVKFSSSFRSHNKPFRAYSGRSDKLMFKALEKNGVGNLESCGIQPAVNSLEDRFVKFAKNSFQVIGSVAAMVFQMGDAIRDVVQQPNTQEELQLLTALQARMVCAAAPLLVAAISQSVNTPLTVVASGMAKWLELYSGVLMVRVLLSWFPNIPWERQPLQAMRDMCDPYLNLFRNIIPPLFNALDLSPMLAFLVLGVLTSILNTTVQAT